MLISLERLTYRLMRRCIVHRQKDFEASRGSGRSDDSGRADLQFARCSAIPADLVEPHSGIVARFALEAVASNHQRNEFSRIARGALKRDSLADVVGVEIIGERAGHVVFLCARHKRTR